jgi:hypothetical protein
VLIAAPKRISSSVVEISYAVQPTPRAHAVQADQRFEQSVGRTSELHTPYASLTLIGAGEIAAVPGMTNRIG